MLSDLDILCRGCIRQPLVTDINASICSFSHVLKRDTHVQLNFVLKTWIVTEYFAAAGILQHEIDHLFCLHHLQCVNATTTLALFYYYTHNIPHYLFTTAGKQYHSHSFQLISQP